jgi:hypothetical protein
MHWVWAQVQAMEDWEAEIPTIVVAVMLVESKLGSAKRMAPLKDFYDAARWDREVQGGGGILCKARRGFGVRLLGKHPVYEIMELQVEGMVPAPRMIVHYCPGGDFEGHFRALTAVVREAGELYFVLGDDNVAGFDWRQEGRWERGRRWLKGSDDWVEEAVGQHPGAAHLAEFMRVTLGVILNGNVQDSGWTRADFATFMRLIKGKVVISELDRIIASREMAELVSWCWVAWEEGWAASDHYPVCVQFDACMAAKSFELSKEVNNPEQLIRSG